jgi:DNA gyrase subunit B/topoisomerase-4 subunit B
LTDAHRDKLIKQLRKGRKDRKIDVQRFKGLGEMMPKMLNETTLDPRTRQLLRVVVKPKDRLETEQTISSLMGKDAAPRYDFIMQNAAQVEDLDV